MHRLLLLLLILAVLLAPTVAAAPQVFEVPAPREKWISLAAEEFDIISGVSPAETMEMARELLRMREAVGQITRLNVRTSARIKVFVFAGARRFAPYRDAAFQRKMPNTTGAYFSGDGGNFILLQNEPGQDIDRTVYHELTHHFARATSVSLPLWFNEGLAEYYSTFKTSGSDVYIGRPVAEHVTRLRDEPLIPLADLLATTVDSPIYNEGQRTNIFYAESWALVHYLMSGSSERRNALGKFLGLVSQDMPVDQAFRDAFGISYVQLEKDLRAYIHRYAFSYTKYSLKEIKVVELAEPVSISRDELLYELGHLYTWTGNAEVAEQLLNEALKVNAQHAGAHADMGRVFENTGRRADADAAYARAVALGSGEALVHLQYGLSILNRLAETSQGRPPETELARARAALLRSIELDPGSARAWTGLGATHVGPSGDRALGIAALEKSLALEPGDPHAAFYLLQLYADAGRNEDAERLFVIVSTAPDRQMIAMARDALVVADVRRAEVLAAADKGAEAIPIAESALARATDPGLREYLQSFLNELHKMESNNKAIDALNEAVTKANAGKRAEAIAILDEAIPSITDPELLARAKELRGDMAKRTRKK